MSTATMGVVTPEHREQFQREGYFVLEGAIPQEHLDLLQRAADELQAEGKAMLDQVDVKQNHKFLYGPHHPKPFVRRFIFSPLMAEITRATLGENVWFNNSQFSYKDPKTGGVFAWHQDGAYINAPHVPYLTTWAAMCDMSEENGTLRLIPRSRAKTKDTVRGALGLKQKDDQYLGDDDGIPLVVPRGSIGVFSSTIFHCSMANQSDQPRVAYIVQYGAEPITGDPGKPGIVLPGEPFVQNGEVVTHS